MEQFVTLTQLNGLPHKIDLDKITQIIDAEAVPKHNIPARTVVVLANDEDRVVFLEPYAEVDKLHSDWLKEKGKQNGI